MRVYCDCTCIIVWFQDDCAQLHPQYLQRRDRALVRTLLTSPLYDVFYVSIVLQCNAVQYSTMQRLSSTVLSLVLSVHSALQAPYARHSV